MNAHLKHSRIVGDVFLSAVLIAASLTVFVITAAAPPAARVIAVRDAGTPDSLSVYRDGPKETQELLRVAFSPCGATVLLGDVKARRSFTKYSTTVLAWNVDKHGALFMAWEDPESATLRIGRYPYYVVFWTEKPETVYVGQYVVTKAERYMVESN